MAKGSDLVHLERTVFRESVEDGIGEILVDYMRSIRFQRRPHVIEPGEVC